MKTALKEILTNLFKNQNYFPTIEYLRMTRDYQERKVVHNTRL